MSCPGASGAYELCIRSSASACRYVLGDGTSVACASCADCTAASTAALAWCSENVDGGTGCVTTAACATTQDCAPWQRCNTALAPAVCQNLFCGELGSACGGDGANDTCASRSCVGAVCVPPPDMSLPCCVPNELGVGKYCNVDGDCAGEMANTCFTGGHACTFQCFSGANCGTNAQCDVDALTMTGECFLRDFLTCTSCT